MQEPSDLLKKVTSVLAIDLLEFAINLDTELLATLVEPPKGIYIKGNIKPILTDDKVYYARSKMPYIQGSSKMSYIIGKQKRIDIQDTAIKDLKEVFTLTEDLVDSDGNVVLSLKDIKIKSRYMSIGSDLPVTAIQLTKTMALDYISTLCKFSRFVYSENIESLVKPEYHYLIANDSFDVAFESLHEQILNFIDQDTWFIYFCRLKGTTLLIEKTIDYRIYYYHEVHYKEWLKNNE